MYQYFSKEELACPCCGISEMNTLFMQRLTRMRRETGIVMPVTSGFRCELHDKDIGGAGVHPQGRAVDMNIYGKDADTIITLSPGYGFTGRGINQKGPYNKRFLHLDDLPDGSHPRPRTWTY